jgi:nucleotide-binding universal stress UspA family protein
LRDLGVEQAILLYCLGIRHLEEMQHLLRPKVEPRLQAQKKLLEQQGFIVRTEIAAGLPQNDVNRIAIERHCSLIVVGTHGQTMSSEIKLGGPASEIIHNSRKPILLMRLKISTLQDRMQCESVCQNMLGHVLFATDFSDNADQAIKTVEELASHGAKRITLMHVQDKAKIDRHLEHRLTESNVIDSERLERLKTQLSRKGQSEVKCDITYGSPVAEILKKAREGDVSLIVMGSQGKGYISEVFLGSVSHQVARHAEVSVLLLPAVR